VPRSRGIADDRLRVPSFLMTPVSPWWRLIATLSTYALMLSAIPTRGAGTQAPQSTEKPARAQAQQPSLATPNSAAPADAVSPDVRRAVDDAIKDRLKDSKVVDVETSQAIASRLADWAKLFAFFVGIPLALLAATLGFLGFRTYSDFSARVTTARDDALKRLDESRKEAETIAKDFEALRAKLAEITSLASQVQELSQKVARIEDVVRFKASPSLTPALKQSLNQSLKDYYDYLKTVGLSLTIRPPTVVIDAKDVNAYYVPAPKNRIVIHPDLAPYPDAPLREFTHHVLSSLKPAWKKGAPDVAGLESGLADYLPSSFLDRSDFGRDIWPIFQRHIPGLPTPSRDVNNQRSFSEISMNEDEHHKYGTVWGGAYWELRRVLGRQTIDKLLLAAWSEFDLAASADDITVFPRELLHQDAVLEAGTHSPKIRDVFQSRGLTL
jgi:hypothetical protein